MYDATVAKTSLKIAIVVQVLQSISSLYQFV